MSPRKKKAKLSAETKKTLKRCNEGNDSLHKRTKSQPNELENIQALKRENFIKACEQVSCAAYLNYAKRLKLIYLPTCVNGNTCKHGNNDLKINQMPSYAEESFNIEIKTNMWCEALEVCFLSITPNQYLSANVLRNVAEIMLNAHEDPDADFTISYILEKCQQILSQNFSTHPPCHMKTIRKCYNNFLTSAMDLKNNTFTNRSQFGCENGIVKYCMNRLEYEISSESKDEPLVDKYENIPEEMLQGVKGLHWQKEKFEIFEALDRNNRIKRLMYVLESLVELLQFDLAIWLSRYSCNSGSQIMRSQRPLMAFILWSDNILYTGAVNNNCRQILRIFAYLVHLQYPEEHIRIMTIWINTIVQTFYICENNSNSDYPNTGKYCGAFAKEFDKIIKALPQESIYGILERIQPTYMQYLMGILHIKSIIPTMEDDIIKIVINFVKNSQWNKYQSSSNKVLSLNTNNGLAKARKIINVSNYLSKIICKMQKSTHYPIKSQEHYPKFDVDVTKYHSNLDQLHVVSTLYITLSAYLDAFSVQHVQDTLDTLNERLHTAEQLEVGDYVSDYCLYSTTEYLIRKYRSIYETLKELMLTLHELKSKEQLPEIFKIFENISFLGL